MKRNYAKSIFLFLGICSFVVSGFLIYNYITIKNQNIRNAKNYIKLEAEKLAKRVDEELKKADHLAQTLANDLSSQKLPKNDIDDRLKKIIEENPQVYSTGVYYIPYSYDPKEKLMVFAHSIQGKVDFLAKESLIRDYTADIPENEWFNKTLAEGSHWIEPMFEPAVNALLTAITYPIFSDSSKKGNPIGVVSVDLSMEKIRNIVKSLDLGKTGYGFLFSKKGAFLYYPVKDYVDNQKTIFDLANDLNKDKLRIIGEDAIKGKSGLVDIEIELTGQTSWLAYQPISGAGWSLGAFFIKDEMPLGEKDLYHLLTWIVISLIFSLIFFSALIFRIFDGGTKSFWFWSSFSAFLFLLGILFIWYHSLEQKRESFKDKTVIIDEEGLKQFLKRDEALALKLLRKKPIYIPAGIFIKDMTFVDESSVKAVGYIWQKYDKETPRDITPGFVFPEAMQSVISESYRRTENDYEVIGWSFVCTLLQNFNYLKYPFDYKDIEILLQHRDFGKGIFLIPDLDSYLFINPSLFPGLDKEVVLRGEEIKASFFAFEQGDYNTTFGIKSEQVSKFPELYFNVVTSRTFINAFIIHVLPLMIVLFIIFALLLVAAKPKEGRLRVEYYLGGYSSLLLVIVFAHIALRSQLIAQEVVYLEYFYFVAYSAIVAVSLSLLLFTVFNVRLIEYKNNLIAKLLYWPVITGVLFAITAWIFY